MKGLISICQRLCNFPCSNRRENEESNHHKRSEKENAQKTKLEKMYPVGDMFDEQRKYEINMLLLYRLYHHKTFHKKILPDMNEKARRSLTQLIVFKRIMPEHWKKHRIARDLFRVGGDECLTALAKYWRMLPNNDEMMMYKDIWEHVAQRPLAWEGLVG
ncbi:MAG: hypothetical protein Q9216_003640 [Gyalolechia sp. 2 TL-2023]